MRHDHTRWLVHFVRDRNPEQDFPGEDEASAFQFTGDCHLEIDASAFQVLRTIVRLGGLLPGYSFRNGRTTIYGGQPAICATEMPIYSFAKYALKKEDASKVSAYGVAFLKSEFFAAGGRPAIYGLSTGSPTYVENTATSRIFVESVLPQAEQYRYVAYNPSGSHWIDWSHEREWRWIAGDKDQEGIWCEGYDTIGFVPGLSLFQGRLEGGHFTRLCLIVWTEEEARELQESLTGFYLAGCNNYSTPFDKELILASRIIVLKTVVDAVENGKNLDAQTIEGLSEANLLAPIVVHASPLNAKEMVEAAFAAATKAGKDAADVYIAAHPTDRGACGFAHAATYEVTNSMVQYLVANKLASGPFDGKVWIKVPEDWPSRQSIDYEEKIMEAVADSLSRSLGITVYVDSRLD